MDKPVMVMCRNCLRLSPAKNYVIDRHYRMAVCLACSKERERLQEKGDVKMPVATQAKSSAGPKVQAGTAAQKPAVKKEMVTCSKCRYTYKLSAANRFCPYCGQKP